MEENTYSKSAIKSLISSADDIFYGRIIDVSREDAFHSDKAKMIGVEGFFRKGYKYLSKGRWDGGAFMFPAGAYHRWCTTLHFYKVKIVKVAKPKKWYLYE